MQGAVDMPRREGGICQTGQAVDARREQILKPCADDMEG